MNRICYLSVTISAVLILLGSAIFAGVMTVHAKEPLTDPVLRIDSEMHIAVIRRIGTDAENRYLVTSSDDKTVRVWECATGKLTKVIRVPIDESNEGKLFAVAISPDSRAVACGGRTGYEWEDSCCVYVFDRESGEMLKRIKELPSVILHLAYSGDGRFLAVMLSQDIKNRKIAHGVRVYNTQDYSLALEDKNYDGAVYGADFDIEGRLITVSDDGYVRLYDPDFKLIKKKKTSGGKHPFSVSFSPDGTKAAVGFMDSRNIDVLSGNKRLSRLFLPSTKGVKNGNLSSVTWSSDGEFLYAGGRWTDSDGHKPVRKWRAKGKWDQYEDLMASEKDSIKHLVALKEGIAFCAADGFGIFDNKDERQLYKTPSRVEYKDDPKALLISHDGSMVEFSYRTKAKASARFSVKDRILTSDPSRDSALTAPLIKGLRIRNWENTYNPQLNGKNLKLKDHEISRSLAISGDKKSFLLGTNWFLRFFDKKGRKRWHVPVPGTAWAVNIPKDGKMAVAALGDGTIRWYRIKDGKEFLAFFPHKDGRRWVLWTSSGYYAASAGADKLIGWHVNNGKDNAPNFFPVSRFRSVYYRPDVAVSILSTQDETEAIRLVPGADNEVQEQPSRPSVQQMLPPMVKIVSPQNATEISDPNVTVKYVLGTPSGEPVTGIRFLLNGRPIPTERSFRRNIKEDEKEIKVPEFQNCEIAVIAENRHTSSEPATVRLLWCEDESKEKEFVVKPKLYILAIGVGEYHHSDISPLAFPAKDVKDFVAVLEKQKGVIYRDVVQNILTDENAARDDILAGLEWMERETTSNDVAMVFLSGHGMNDRNGNYYFLPKDANPDSLKRTGIPYSVIEDTVKGLPGKLLFFVDTCHSGNVIGSRRRGDMPDIDQLVNELSTAENGAVVFASSTGRQYSLENEIWGNGAFTKALVDGLSGKADYSRNGAISINELNLYLSERVKELTKGQQTPTTVIPETMPDFEFVALSQ